MIDSNHEFREELLPAGYQLKVVAAEEALPVAAEPRKLRKNRCPRCEAVILRSDHGVCRACGRGGLRQARCQRCGKQATVNLLYGVDTCSDCWDRPPARPLPPERKPRKRKPGKRREPAAREVLPGFDGGGRDAVALSQKVVWKDHIIQHYRTY